MTSRTTRSDRGVADVIIVGAGVIGLACAWRLAERGARAIVCERENPGAGASGVAAGMLAPVGEASWGEEELLALALESHELWPAFARELSSASGEDVGLSRLGALHIALDRDEAGELARRFELMRELGLEAERLLASECRALEPGLGSAGLGGVFAPHEAAIDPRAATRALVVAIERAGGAIVTGERGEVVEAILEPDRSAGPRISGVRTAAGDEYRADTVILAAGAASAAGWLPPEARPAVRPVKGQILTLAGPAASPVCTHIVVSERVYVVPRTDGRLVIGATVEEQGFDTRITAGAVHELLREAYRLLPEIAELELAGATAGLRPATPDNRPLIGRSPLDGLVLATGHFRNGILLAPVTAQRVADLVERGDQAAGAASPHQRDSAEQAPSASGAGEAARTRGAAR